MRIQLKSITINNFKGIRSQHIEFNAIETSISGDNGTGKSSVYDALLWVLFGKNAAEEKDFSIKTLTPEGNPIEKLEHEVELELLVDDTLITLKRTLREKWVKKKGNEVAEFTGNETVYSFDGVPMQQKEFQQRIDNILNEETFKLITSTTAFNSLTWQRKREVLLKISGGIDIDAILSQLPGSEAVLEIIKGAKSPEEEDRLLDDHKKRLAAQIKKSKDELEKLPVRINEATNSKPAVPEGGFDAVQKVIDEKAAEVEKIDNELQDKSKAFDTKISELNAKKKELNESEDKANDIRKKILDDVKKKAAPGDSKKGDDLKQNLTSKKSTLTTYQNGKKTLEGRAETIKKRIEELSTAMTGKRSEWAAENAKELTFDVDTFCCPTCQREFEEDQIEGKKSQLQTNFDTDKKKKLEKINSQGKEMAAEKSQLETELKELDSRLVEGNKTIELLQGTITEIETEISSIEAALSSAPKINLEEEYQKQIAANEELQAISTKCLTLKTEIATMTEHLAEPVDVTNMKERKRILNVEIDAHKQELFKKDQIEKIDARVKELEAEEKALAHSITKNEGVLYLIEKFNKLKIETLEKNINSRFSLVKFKMFEDQINGGQKETCICTINGVPYSDANTASKVNAGVDIINVLGEHYNVTGPVFVDNRESVIELQPTRSQIINLYAKKGVKSLQIA